MIDELVSIERRELPLESDATRCAYPLRAKLFGLCPSILAGKLKRGSGLIVRFNS